MNVSLIGSLTTLLGIFVVFLALAWVAFGFWKNNKQSKSLKSIDQTFSQLLGEDTPQQAASFISHSHTDTEKTLRPWTCIHCGTVNPAIENSCHHCGKESQS